MSLQLRLKWFYNDIFFHQVLDLWDGLFLIKVVFYGNIQSKVHRAAPNLIVQ